MKLHTANGSSIEVKPEGLQAVLTIWSKGQPTRSVKLYPTEIDTIVKALQDSQATIGKRRTAGDHIY